MEKYVLALDQGTTSSRAILFNREGRAVAQRSEEVRALYPEPSWVEQDPEEIWRSQTAVAAQVLTAHGIDLNDIAAVGITNQRETTLVWDRATGKCIAPAIVWQDRRTADVCEALKRDGYAEVIRAKTGLIPDAYFSATKLQWLLDHVPGARERAEAGELCFGTVDTFLAWRLSGGAAHVSDYSNASRTMLFNIHTLEWDADLLEAFRIPRMLLPAVRPSSAVIAEVAGAVFGVPGAAPLAGIAGDQQAATFGQACFAPGQAKNTYGTGCFLLMNTGQTPARSNNRLLTTIGWGIGGAVTYCLEGSVFAAGAAVQYLRDGLRLVATAAETSDIAASVPDTGGVYFVPAFAGLGAPYWDQYARGAILGLTRGSGRAEIVRATLEAVAYQTRDLVEAMTADAGTPLPVLRADGAMVANDFLMQFQADLLGIPVERAANPETTALGAAYLAGLAVGFFDAAQVAARVPGRVFEPAMAPAERDAKYAGWKRAVERARGWKVS